MSSTTAVSSILRQNPALIAVLVGTGIAIVVLGVLAVAMKSAGVSLKPLIWFAGFITIIAGPQVAIHVAQALGWIPNVQFTYVRAQPSVPTTEYRENEVALAEEGGRFKDPAAVFGEDVDPSLVSDLRPALGGFLQGSRPPTIAQMGISRRGEMGWVARFADPAEARAGRARLSAWMGIAPASDPAASVWAGPRPAGDHVALVLAGRTVVAFAGASSQDAHRRLAASGAVAKGEVSITPKTEPAPGTAPTSRPWYFRLPGIALLGAVMLVAAVLWFFKGLSWATRLEPRPGQAAISQAELTRRLLALNDTDTPFQVTTLPGDEGIAITWRYGDARWVDFAGVHALRRTHRMVLRPDPVTRRVRVTDYMAAWDASLGRNGAKLDWRAGTGITLFQVESVRGLGWQLGPNGLPTPDLSYQYTFKLSEMRAPAIATVTGSGWTWQPVAWNGPAWLRWLTE